MKKANFYLIIVIFLFFNIITINAQLRVLVTEGENFLSTSTNEIQKLSVNQNIKSTDKIILNSHGKVILFDEKGEIFTLKSSSEKKTYLVDDLLATEKNRNNFLQTFFKYVANQIIADQSNFTDTIPGAVERSTTAIKIEEPKGELIFDNFVNLRWNDILNNSDYNVVIKNIVNDTVVSLKVNKKYYKLNLDALKLNPNECYFLSVQSNANPEIKSEENCIKIMSDEEKNKIIIERKMIEDYFNDSNDDLSKGLVLAKFYEKKDLIDHAYSEYRMLYEQNKNLEFLNKLYKQFLLKNSIQNVFE